MQGNSATTMECTFCGAPLRPMGGAGEDGSGMECFCPCGECKRPEVLVRCSVQEALRREDFLEEAMLCAADLPEASIVLYRGEDFPALVPEVLRSRGLCVVRLPGCFESRLDELAATQLNAWRNHSADLSRADAHLGWDMTELSIHFPLGRLSNAFTLEGDEPCILFLFISAGTVVLSSYPIDEMFMGILQGCEIGAGENYRPERVWTREELRAAEVDARSKKVRFVQILDDGTVDIELQGYIRQP